MARRRDKAAALSAGLQASAAMRMCKNDELVRRGASGVKRGTGDDEDWWYYEARAVAMARTAARHAFNARPKLKPPTAAALIRAQVQAVRDRLDPPILGVRRTGIVTSKINFKEGTATDVVVKRP